MAAYLKTVQSEIAKTEAGELPPESDLARWAKAYGLSKKKFRTDCEAAQWVLLLWKYAVTTPKAIEVIDCTPTRGFVDEDDPECDHARRIAQ